MTNPRIMKCWHCGADVGHQDDENCFFWCNFECREAYELGVRRMEKEVKQATEEKKEEETDEINGHTHRTGVPAAKPAPVARLEPEPVTEGVPEPLQFPVISLPPEAEILPLELAPVSPPAPLGEVKGMPPMVAPNPTISFRETPEAPPQPAPEPLRVPVGPVPEGPAPGTGSDAPPVPEGASEAWPAAYLPSAPTPTLSAEELRARKPQNTGKKQRICGNCGESGHNKRTCPAPASVAPTPLKEKRCGNCGKPGHNARTCKAEAAEWAGRVTAVAGAAPRSIVTIAVTQAASGASPGT